MVPPKILFRALPSVLVGLFLVAIVVFAWTEPTSAPPGGNVPAPLNVSNVGQSKEGGLILNTGGALNGLIVQNGNVGIGTVNPDNGRLHMLEKLIKQETATGWNWIEINRGSSQLFFGEDASNRGIWSNSTRSFGIYTDSVSRFWIQQGTGNIGIGTTGPGAKLSFADLNDSRDTADGITWYNPAPTLYGIYRSAGTWVPPNYQQLTLSWSTGIVLNPGTAYGKSYVDVQGNGLRTNTLCLSGDCRTSWPSGGGGDVTGSGSANYIAKFTGAKSIGDSLIAEVPAEGSVIRFFGATNFDGYGSDSWFPYTNGVNYLRGNLQFNGTLYDENDNGYYINPNSTSIFSDLRASIFYDKEDATYYTNPAGGTSANLAGNVLAGGYVRAPEFYDSNDTAYYVNPAGTSNMSVVSGSQLNGDIFYDNNNNTYYVDPNSASNISSLTVNSILTVDRTNGIRFGSNYRITSAPSNDNWARLLNVGDNNYVGDGTRDAGFAAANLWAKNDIYLGAKSAWLGDIPLFGGAYLLREGDNFCVTPNPRTIGCSCNIPPSTEYIDVLVGAWDGTGGTEKFRGHVCQK